MANRTIAALVLSVVAFAVGWFVRGASPVSAPTANTSPGGTLSAPGTKEAFEAVYGSGRWGLADDRRGTSGPGSTMQATLHYRQFLQEFLKSANIKSVVDAGCGDWEFSQSIDWNGIDYKGYDIVPAVIEADKKKYQKPNVQFFVGNVVDDDLPPADLLICKHVLQHIPNADGKKFLAVQVPKYRHSIIVNSVDMVTLSSENADIKPGDYRPLDITKPPFDMHGAKLLTYYDGHHMQQVIHIGTRR